jgi:hypothetical protein
MVLMMARIRIGLSRALMMRSDRDGLAEAMFFAGFAGG